MSEEVITIRDLEWPDRISDENSVNIMQFADRLSRIIYMTALQVDVAEDSERFQILMALAAAIGETVESFGPHGDELPG